VLLHRPNNHRIEFPVIINGVDCKSEDMIYGVPRRPRIADASASTIAWAIAGGLIAGPLGVLIGGAAGNALANQRQPLEMAIREYFTRKDLDLVFFYPAPRAVKVTFRDSANAYWTVESALPDNLPFASTEDANDWLYGNLIVNQLPQVAPEIRLAS
jgi:hypothetical protein